MLLVGFRYRRIASLGSSSRTGGILSSVKGTRGSMVSIDRVRRSSGGMEEAVNVDMERAAERSARRDAVRFDLKTDRSGTAPDAGFFSIDVGVWLKTRKSSWSISFMDRGSPGSSPGGVRSGSKDLLGGRNRLPLGVTGESMEGAMLVPRESPRDGILSSDATRVEKVDVKPLSLVIEH